MTLRILRQHDGDFRLPPWRFDDATDDVDAELTSSWDVDDVKDGEAKRGSSLARRGESSSALLPLPLRLPLQSSPNRLTARIASAMGD